MLLADVERGVWRPATSPPMPQLEVEADRDPLFWDFASDWFEACKEEWRQNTQAAYRSELVNHLLPFFKAHRLSQISVPEVDRYRQSKVAELERVKSAAAKGTPLTYEYGRQAR